MGELGTGQTSTVASAPTPVASDLAWSQIAAGHEFTCGISGNLAYCWGNNFFGQLGTGTTANSLAPVPVVGGMTFVALTASDSHTCGIQAASLKAFCWGSNTAGQLGAAVSGSSAVPVEVGSNSSNPDFAFVTFSVLSAGSDFTCGNSVDAGYGNIENWCWGAGTDGQLGNNGDSDSTEPVKVAGSQSFVSVSAGGEHACALDDSALAWCWGAGEKGQLGTGTKGRVSAYQYYKSTIPLPVTGGIPFYSVSAGGAFTCGVSPKAAPTPPAPAPIGIPPPASPSPVQAGGSPPAAPSPAAPPQEAPSSSSSAPVGAIVGAVAGAAVAALLAFLAFRPGKGWLRRKGVAAAVQLPADVDKEPGSTDWKLAPSTAPPSHGLDSLLPSSSASMPLSYATSAGSRALRTPALAANPGSDSMLSYISSYLASCPGTNASSRSTPGGGCSGSQALSPEAELWQVAWSELQVERVIGHGSFGRVYLAHWQETPCAVKVLLNKDAAHQQHGLELPSSTMRELQAEVAVMIRMRHPNVVQFLGLCSLPPALITEYCSRGSLFDCLQAGRADPAAAAQLTWARRLAMAVDAATGLLYLHGRNIVHRDVKSPNYLVDEHWKVKASDFNLSKLLGGEEPGAASSTGGPGNPIWLAPEVLRGARASASSDVFSFGMVLWELLTWRLPWAGCGMSAFQIGAKIVAGERPVIPPREELPGPDSATFAGLEAYCQLVRDCWAQDATQRPTMAQVVRRLRALLQHPTGAEPPADATEDV
ncbi:hypothetical protein ABPG77_010887 [Micractinium sp. CCAP 211/92]